MDAKQRQDCLEFAVDAARDAGEITLQHFASDVGYEMKADNSPVTIADRSVEEMLRNRIREAFPTHGIVGEEFGTIEGSEPARWIIDPIDGTFSFICRVPLYAVLIGLEWQGEMVVGVINAPAVREMAYAAKGLGCTWEGPQGQSRPARVSSVSELSKARVLHGGPKLHEQFGKAAGMGRVCQPAYAERGWCDAYAHLLVATGRAEIMLDPILSLWDTAALLPVVTEAGGTLTDWSGNPTHTAPEAISTNSILHEEVLRLVRE